MNSKEELLEYIKSKDSVKRLKDLEKMIDNNKDIKKLLNQKKLVSKQMVNAKKLDLMNAYKEYQKEYDQIDLKLSTYPFVEEYMDLLNDEYNDLNILIDYIQNQINKDL